MYSMIHVEPVRGCNLSCHFCPHSLEDNGVSFMSMDTVEVIADHLTAAVQRTGRTLRVCLAGRGEPALHPDFIGIVRRLAKVPKVRVIAITNGVRLSTTWMQKVRGAGLHALHIDIYNQTIKEKIAATLWPMPIDTISGANIWTTKEPCVVLCDEREKRRNDIRKLHNWAGAARKEYWTGDIPRHSACSHPLKMVTVRYDGSYALCCNSWDNLVDLGTVQGCDFDEQYNRKDRLDICNMIMRPGGRACVVPCMVCNAYSPRAHLWKRALRERGYEI